MQKTAHFLYSMFEKGHNSNKNGWKLTTLELDLLYSKTKSYAIFQLDMSKHVGEKCGKLHITYILSSQRGITPSKIDANWRHSNLVCSTVKQSHVQNFSSICQSMYEKSAENRRTETGRRVERTDGWRVGRTDITIPEYVPSEDGRIKTLGLVGRFLRKHGQTVFTTTVRVLILAGFIF